METHGGEGGLAFRPRKQHLPVTIYMPSFSSPKGDCDLKVKKHFIVFFLQPKPSLGLGVGASSQTAPFRSTALYVLAPPNKTPWHYSMYAAGDPCEVLPLGFGLRAESPGNMTSNV